MANQGKILSWSVLQLSQGKVVDVHHSRGSTPEAAFRNLRPFVRKNLREYRIEPFPERLRVHCRHNLTFEVPGPEGENGYPVKVHEYFNGIGFSYQPLLETAADVEQIAPMPAVKRIAKIAKDIIKDLALHPRAFIIGIKESMGIGDVGYEGRAIVSQRGLTYVELELVSFPLEDIDYWEGMLWHEAMHVKYVLEGRWPSIWPFYNPDIAGPLWALDCLIHFSIDGWLEKHHKPTVYWPPEEKPDADFKTSRFYELLQCLEGENCTVTEDRLKKTTDNLWERDTNILEVSTIMRELGLEIPEPTPLGQYLRRRSERR